MRICSIEGCDKPVAYSYLCTGHLSQRQRGLALRPLQQTVIPTVLERLSITYRQFDYWCNHHYVEGLEGQGHGYRRFQSLTPEQKERLEALATAAKLRELTLPELADAIQDGTVKCIEGFRGD